MRTTSLTPYIAILFALVGACSSEVNATYCDSTTMCDSSASASFCNIADNTCITPPSVNSCNRVQACENAALPFCSDEASGGVCVECLDTSQCTGSDLCSDTTSACEAFGCSPDTDGDALCAQFFPERPYCGAADTCATCRESAHCTDAAAPVCDPVDLSCRQCEANSECESGFCEFGICVDSQTIVFVASDGSSDATCGAQELPCLTVGAGLLATTATRNIVQIAAGRYSEELTISTGEVTLRAEGEGEVVFDASVSGVEPMLTVSGDASVNLEGLSFDYNSNVFASRTILCSDTSSISLNRVSFDNNDSSCIALQGTCTMEVTDSTISNSTCSGIAAGNGSLTVTNSTFLANLVGINSGTGSTISIENSTFSGGEVGINVNGSSLQLRSSYISNNTEIGVRINSSNFVVVNNFIVQNGRLNDTGSGVEIRNTDFQVTQQFDFNTVAGNRGFTFMEGFKADNFDCNTLSPLVAIGNIVYQESTEGNNVRLQGACSFSQSSVQGDSGNDFLPRFVNPVAGPLGDYHILPNSQCIDRLNATLDVDFDGDMRPLGIRHDLGADEAQ